MRGARLGPWLAVAGALALGGCDAAVRSGLTEEEANRVALALEAAGIAATKASAGPGHARGFEVQVASADVASALRVLERENVPRPVPPGFAELYAEAGLVATPAEERARWAAATAGELARSIERFAGVLEARVHLSLPEPQRPLDAPAGQARASVLIRRRPGARAVDGGAVQALVAGAVDGLAPGQVTVVQVASEAHHGTGPSLVQVGPIRVTRGSAFVLKAVLGTALALDAALAIALLVLWRVHRRRVQEPG